MALSVQQKEQLIVGTILSCNNEIKKISQIMPKLNESIQNTNVYHFNMKSLFNDINPLLESFQNIPDESIYVKNTRGNYLSYFQKVYEFLDGYEVNLQTSLNESLNVEGNSIQIDIVSFKKDLKTIINELLKKNDLENISPEILKIKTLANIPISIYGYDICNNISLQKELVEKFNLTSEKLLAICFDKSNKQILFVTNSTNSIIVYDLKKDMLDNYNTVNNENKIPSKPLSISTYFSILQELINNNIIVLYLNINELKLNYTDNLFGDESRIKYIQQMQNQEKIRKQEQSIIRK